MSLRSIIYAGEKKYIIHSIRIYEKKMKKETKNVREREQ